MIGAGWYIETYPQSSKLFKKLLKIIALAYIYQLAEFDHLMKIIALAYIYQLVEFGHLMSWGSKDILKDAPCLIYWYSS